MVENTGLILVLRDGTSINFEYDSAGNYKVASANVAKLTGENLTGIQMKSGNTLLQMMEPQAVRGCTDNGDGTSTVCMNAKTAEELLKEENELLTECILEMSEIIYGE